MNTFSPWRSLVGLVAVCSRRGGPLHHPSRQNLAPRALFTCRDVECVEVWRREDYAKSPCRCRWSAFLKAWSSQTGLRRQHRAFTESSMSLWFKFYPKSLSSHQLQYCLKKQPTSALIYIWCLGCCAEEGR